MGHSMTAKGSVCDSIWQTDVSQEICQNLAASFSVRQDGAFTSMAKGQLISTFYEFAYSFQADILEKRCCFREG